jgi:hypothetical protein
LNDKLKQMEEDAKRAKDREDSLRYLVQSAEQKAETLAKRLEGASIDGYPNSSQVNMKSLSPPMKTCIASNMWIEIYMCICLHTRMLYNIQTYIYIYIYIYYVLHGDESFLRIVSMQANRYMCVYKLSSGMAHSGCEVK